MADLVSLTEQKQYMGIPVSVTTFDQLLQALLDGGEALLESACDRTDVPFQAAESGRVEVLDGTGSGTLYVAYAIATLTSILIGANPAAPDETLNVADPTVVRFGVGDTKISRVDGGEFGEDRDPRMVQVTYDTEDFLPEDAKLALKRLVALIYQQRGSEDATQESDSGYSHVLAKYATDLPDWAAAVAKYKLIAAQ